MEEENVTEHEIRASDVDVDEATMENEKDREQEAAAWEELKRQVEARDARHINIDLFLNKVVHGCVHDKWFCVEVVGYTPNKCKLVSSRATLCKWMLVPALPS